MLATLSSTVALLSLLAGAPAPQPAVQSFAGPGGLRIHAVTLPGAERVAARLTFRSGRADLGWQADALAAALAAPAADGPTVGAEVTEDTFAVTLDAAPAQLAAALTALAKPVKRPALSGAPTGRAREALERLAAGKSDASQVARRWLATLAYPKGHPYAARPLPDAAALAALTPATLEALAKTVVAPNHADLVLVGPGKATAMGEAAVKAFRGWKAVKARKLPRPSVERVGRYEQKWKPEVHLIDRPDAAEAVILVGNLALSHAHPDQPLAALANALAGEATTGRVARALVTRRKLCAAVGATLTARLAPGLASVHCRAPKAQAGEAMKLLLAHWKTLRASAAQPAELEATRGVLSARGRGAVAVAASLATAVALGATPARWRQGRSKLASATPEEVRAAARSYLHEHPVVIIVGPSAFIASQLDAASAATLRRHRAQEPPR